MRALALPYCILYCHVWLLSFGGLLLSEMRQRRIGSRGEGRKQVAGSSGERENCSWDDCVRDYYFEKIKGIYNLNIKLMWNLKCDHKT